LQRAGSGSTKGNRHTTARPHPQIVQERQDWKSGIAENLVKSVPAEPSLKDRFTAVIRKRNSYEQIFGELDKEIEMQHIQRFWVSFLNPTLQDSKTLPFSTYIYCHETDIFSKPGG